jgi:hypothetical protein
VVSDDAVYHHIDAVSGGNVFHALNRDAVNKGAVSAGDSTGDASGKADEFVIHD